MNERVKEMKKIYETARIEILQVKTAEMMIPAGTSYPEPFAPQRHFVPGPGPSYDPQGSVV